MPFASEKQRRFMHAAASGRLRKDGPSPEQARSFIRHSEPEESPGLRHRREQFELLRDAAEGGSVQARMRLGAAKRALGRQEAISRTRKLLNRVKGRY